MRILLDQGTPVPLRAFLKNHTVSAAAEVGWDRLRNGDLLTAAEKAGFDMLLTTDKNLQYQQNLKERRIAIVVIGDSQWPTLRQHVQRVVDAVNAATPGSYAEVEIPYKKHI
jgi:hypothetical protein